MLVEIAFVYLCLHMLVLHLRIRRLEKKVYGEGKDGAAL